MEEKRVSFEVAKLAKEKGFTKGSGYMGWIDKFYHIRTGTILPFGRTGNTKKENLVYIPTQALLQKWLREVHDIHVTCDPVNNGENFGYHSKYCYYGGDLPRWPDGIMERGLKLFFTIGTKHGLLFKNTIFNKYEEALEVGLLKALNLIKDES